MQFLKLVSESIGNKTQWIAVYRMGKGELFACCKCRKKLGSMGFYCRLADRLYCKGCNREYITLCAEEINYHARAGEDLVSGGWSNPHTHYNAVLKEE